MNEVFVCHFHGRIGYTEVVNMPIWKRQWFLRRVKKEMETLYPKSNTNKRKR